jgi:hypothetical protein
MEETVSVAQAVTAREAVLPVRMQKTLGELVGAAKEGCWRSASASGSVC